MYSVASDGSGAIERLTDSSNDQYPNSIMPDGTILYAEIRPKTGLDILRRPLAAAHGAAGADLVTTSSHEYAGNISPDGRYFAYVSSGPDGLDVYVRPYPGANPFVRISPAGGAVPVWARTGHELFYLDRSNTLMAVPVDTSGPQFKSGHAAKVFDMKYWSNLYSYDVAKDGRFLMMKETTDSELNRARIVVVLNWHEELKRLVPTN
jgi:hypothetical protein